MKYFVLIIVLHSVTLHQIGFGRTLNLQEQSFDEPLYNLTYETSQQDNQSHAGSLCRHCNYRGYCGWNKIDKDFDCDCEDEWKGINCELEASCYDEYDEYCNNNGDCVDPYDLEGAYCECHIGWKGENCQFKKECTKGICGDGTCTEKDEPGFYCKCPVGKKGKTCQFETCSNNDECRNGGTCSEELCICKPGFLGDKCDIVFECTSEGKYKGCIESGGNCTHDGTESVCICPENQKYHNIEHTCKDLCMPNPCKNDGKCSVAGLGVVCNCTGPWKGKTCETACVCIGGECVNENEERICRCPPGFGNFTNSSCKACDCGPDSSCLWRARLGGKMCICKPGYHDKLGKCVDCECGPDSNCTLTSEGWLKPPKKVCHCQPGYYEKDGKCVGPCSSNPCQNDGLCVVHDQTFKCECKPPFEGKHCEIEFLSTMFPMSKIDISSIQTIVTTPKAFVTPSTSPKTKVTEFLSTMFPKSRTEISSIQTIVTTPKAFVTPKTTPKTEITDFCITNPCKNDGICRLQGTTFLCYCKNPYFGKLCEKSKPIILHNYQFFSTIILNNVSFPLEKDKKTIL